ncbi:MAG: hypothetical protein ABIH42_00100 [Planctomycetota bacterium]
MRHATVEKNDEVDRIHLEKGSKFTIEGLEVTITSATKRVDMREEEELRVEADLKAPSNFDLDDFKEFKFFDMDGNELKYSQPSYSLCKSGNSPATGLIIWDFEDPSTTIVKIKYVFWIDAADKFSSFSVTAVIKDE